MAMEKLGSLWKKKSKDGSKTFLSGKIGEQDVIIFTNTRKSKDSQPDFEVFKSEPRNGGKPQQQKPRDEFDF